MDSRRSRKRNSAGQWMCVLVLMLASMLLLSHDAMAHPLLIVCVCNSTVATMPVIRTVPSPSKGQAAKLVLPECVNDVFARSGIRWYENGPYDGRINYWRREPSVPYSEGRAAKRLISQGYRCDATQLYDPNEIIV